MRVSGAAVLLALVALAPAASARLAARGPIERAVMALISLHLYPPERGFIDANQFRVRDQDFAWRLNDVTGRH